MENYHKNVTLIMEKTYDRDISLIHKETHTNEVKNSLIIIIANT